MGSGLEKPAVGKGIAQFRAAVQKACRTALWRQRSEETGACGSSKEDPQQ